MKNIALLSTAFSGSTLVSMLVSSHPKIIGFGDTYNYQFVQLSKTSCTCGSTPSISCPVRISVEDYLKSKGDSFRWLTSNPTPVPNALRSSKMAARIFRKRQWLHIYRRFPDSLRLRVFGSFYLQNARFLDALAMIDGKTHYFDGCKDLTRQELLRTVYPDTKIVHLIKNPNAYLYSFLKRVPKDYRVIVRNWITYHSAAVDLGKRLGPDRYMLVTFEEMTRSPEEMLKKLYHFMEVPERGEPFAQWIDLSTIHVVGSGTKNEFKQVDRKLPLWKSELTKEQLNYVDKKTESIDWLQPVLSRLDY